MRSLCVLFYLAMPAFGQPEEPSPSLPVTKLTLAPTAAPFPVLRHELLPNYREQIAGNAALSYHRAMLIKSEHREIDPNAAALRDQNLDERAAGPDKQVNAEELRPYLAGYRQVFRKMENGARR